MTVASEMSAEVRLPKPPGIMRRFLADHPLAVDVFIVVCYILGAGFGVLLDFMMASSDAFVAALENGPVDMDVPPPFIVPGYLAWPWLPIAIIRVLVVAAALLMRRKYPLAGLIVVLLVSTGGHGVQSVATGVALCFLIYAVPVYQSVRAGWLGFSIAYVGGMLQVALGEPLEPTGGATTVSVAGEDIASGGRFEEFIVLAIISGLWYLAILMLGINLGNRRRYLSAVIDRANQLATERDRMAQLAVAEERARIAREMHDIVAHSVSVMIALSEGAARAAEVAPEAAADAMRRSAETGRTALTEMRRLLGALNSEDTRAELAPQPSLCDLEPLVEGFREAGLQVGLAIEGSGSGDAGQELAVYRVVQEGLTNALRYAGVGARAEVRVETHNGSSRVSVRDFGPPPGMPRPETGIGSGRGITGLGERARILGGTLESGEVPGANGPGWELRAELPANTAADETTATPRAKGNNS